MYLEHNLAWKQVNKWLVSISFGDLMYLEHVYRSIKEYARLVSISFGDLMYLELRTGNPQLRSKAAVSISFGDLMYLEPKMRVDR